VKVNPRKYGPERRTLLEPLAHAHGLDYDRETAFQGARPVQTAFLLVGCGADVLSGLRYADAIPTTNRKLARATAKAVARRFREEQGRHAAVFLSQAFGTWYVEQMSQHGDATSAAIHHHLRDLIQQFFPLGDTDRELLEALRDEYRVMVDHDMSGRMPVTGYHTALIAPTFAEGRAVDDAPELVKAQERYASRYLRLLAERRAIALCVGEREFSARRSEFLQPSWPGYEVLEYDAGSLSWWTNSASDWQRIGSLALGLEQPTPRPLGQQLANDLVTRAMEIVGAPAEQPWPDASRRAAGTFTAELSAGSPADQALAMDALIIGYRVRDAETALCKYNHFDPDTLRRYLLLRGHEQVVGLTAAGAALEVAGAMPAAFSGPDRVWAELRAWVADHAIQRAWQRHALGTEGGDDAPKMSDEDVAIAVDQGYALRFAELELA
jgi:hypothetical protein